MRRLVRRLGCLRWGHVFVNGLCSCGRRTQVGAPTRQVRR